jgi:hypothetical protein
MPGFSHLGRGINEIVEFLVTGKDTGVVNQEAAKKDAGWQKYRNEGYILFRDPEDYPPLTPPWGTLNAIDLNKGDPVEDSVRRIPRAGREGHEGYRERQLRWTGSDRQRVAADRRHELR